MTEKKFICEINSNCELNVNQFDNYVEISITNENGKINFVHLTISDAEQLMDDLHKLIFKIEGGSNE
jgi:hypothetical protein